MRIFSGLSLSIHPHGYRKTIENRTTPLRGSDSNLSLNTLFLLPDSNLLRRGGLPDFSRAVSAGRHDFQAVRRESDGENSAVMPLEREHFPASGGIPQPRCSIRTAGENPPVVWRKGGRHDLAPMSLKGELKLARLCVPDFGGKIAAARENPLAIG